MANKVDKLRRSTERKRQEDIFSYKILATLLVVIAAIFALVQVDRGYDSPRTLVTTEEALGIVRWAAFIVFAALEICALVFRSKPWIAKLMGMIGMLFLTMGVSCVYILWTYGRAMSFLYVAFPVLAFLYLFYHIFQREFFWLSLYASGGAMGLWFLSRLILNGARKLPLPVGYALALVAVLLSAAVFFLFMKNDGKLSIGKKTLKILPSGGRYLFLFIAAAILLLLIILTMLIGWRMAWYGVFVMFAYAFVMAVYYTVKMM